MITNVSLQSFKGYIPVTYYARYPDKDKYYQVLKKENIRKCQSFVTRNLNKTASDKMRNDSFTEKYRAVDRDYRYYNNVHSIYAQNEPVVYMVTGADTDTIREYAKPVGKAKGESIDTFGHAKSFEANNESKKFFYNVKAFLRGKCKRIQNDNKQNLSMQVFYKAKLNRKQEVTGFEYEDVKFTAEG